MISDKENNIDTELLRLKYFGQTFEDDETLDYYNVANNATLYLQLKF